MVCQYTRSLPSQPVQRPGGLNDQGRRTGVWCGEDTPNGPRRWTHRSRPTHALVAGHYCWTCVTHFAGVGLCRRRDTKGLPSRGALLSRFCPCQPDSTRVRRFFGASRPGGERSRTSAATPTVNHFFGLRFPPFQLPQSAAQSIVLEREVRRLFLSAQEARGCELTGGGRHRLGSRMARCRPVVCQRQQAVRLHTQEGPAKKRTAADEGNHGGEEYAR
jgi:hypothetical protein